MWEINRSHEDASWSVACSSIDCYKSLYIVRAADETVTIEIRQGWSKLIANHDSFVKIEIPLDHLQWLCRQVEERLESGD